MSGTSRKDLQAVVPCPARGPQTLDACLSGWVDAHALNRREDACYRCRLGASRRAELAYGDDARADDVLIVAVDSQGEGAERERARERLRAALAGRPVSAPEPVWTAALDAHIAQHGGVKAMEAQYMASQAGATKGAAANAIHSRVRSGALVRVARGVYLVPGLEVCR